MKSVKLVNYSASSIVRVSKKRSGELEAWSRFKIIGERKLAMKIWFGGEKGRRRMKRGRDLVWSESTDALREIWF